MKRDLLTNDEIAELLEMERQYLLAVQARVRQMIEVRRPKLRLIKAEGLSRLELID